MGHKFANTEIDLISLSLRFLAVPRRTALGDPPRVAIRTRWPSGLQMLEMVRNLLAAMQSHSLPAIRTDESGYAFRFCLVRSYLCLSVRSFGGFHWWSQS
ncbi:hypothetical protein SBA5_120062 [Candidatus Sulfotelmatomonas gaucii]|uniref:Uncharacterized protein n=1 Tax=Candidatus Sulfuritelmatomonas gaucii TaxID=2043161 RepID=A0A2N9L3V5_9BACT|nr:hypothetical protein SBA5_120062 [Candidatus Sulfotelmatomonas gaucii]